MSAYARYSADTAPDYGHLNEDYTAATWLPGERIVKRRRGPRLKVAVSWLLLAAIAAGGWHWRDEPLLRDTVRSGWAMAVSTATDVWSRIEVRTPPPTPARTATAEPAAAQPAEAPAPPVEVTKVAAEAPAAVPPDAKPYEEAAAPTAAAKAGAAPAAGTTAAKAAAAGLHPDLSATLLAKLSDADFRNASAAIGKAMTLPTDEDVLIWPEKKAAGVALFRVHFVEGAAEGCRRYVVTISKDGWLTTALPMERCPPNQKQAATAR